MTGRSAPSSAVIRLLEGRELPPVAVIDAMVNDGYDVDDVVRLLRAMLQKGEIGLGRDMDLRLLRQPA